MNKKLFSVHRLTGFKRCDWTISRVILYLKKFVIIGLSHVNKNEIMNKKIWSFLGRTGNLFFFYLRIALIQPLSNKTQEGSQETTSCILEPLTFGTKMSVANKGRRGHGVWRGCRAYIGSLLAPPPPLILPSPR